MHAVLGTSDHCIATYPGDFAQALIALDAAVEIAGPDGNRTIPFAACTASPADTPDKETTLQPGEMIVSFLVPAAPWTRRSLYLKVRDRESYEFALASAAVALDQAEWTSCEMRALRWAASRPCRGAPSRPKLLTRQTNERAEPLRLRPMRRSPSAKGYGHNDFKIELGKRTLRARAAASGGVGDLIMANAAAPHPKENMGAPAPRYDARLKVTGEARYPADIPVANPAYAVLVTSTIAKGSIKSSILTMRAPCRACSIS